LVSGIGKRVESGRFGMELGETGFEAGNIAAQGAHFGGVLELAAGLLEAQLEKFLAQVAALGLEFGLG